MWKFALAVVLGLSQSPAAFAQDFVPFVIPTTPDANSAIAFTYQPVPADAPRVTARDGHFYVGPDRYRVWGVNTCFGASLSSHEDARRVAARLAAAGVNGVRIHHLDTANYPAGIWDPCNPGQFSPDALDRLDFYIDQLAQHGIRVDLNLHVGRTHSRSLALPAGGDRYTFDKMVDLFTPQLIDAQRRYAHDLLTHVNAYRHVRYADDPAIAFVEINNEDSLFMWSWRENLPQLPAFYAGILRDKYVAWLKDRYGTTDKLRAAWSAGSSPLGANFLPPLAAPQDKPDAKHPWRLEQHDPCRAAVTPPADPNDGLRFEIAASDSTVWHLQYNAGGLALRKGQFYTLTFLARSDKPRPLAYGIGQAHDPWKALAPAGQVKLTGEWQVFREGFTAAEGERDARVSFSFGGGDNTPFELADVRLCPGGRTGLEASESLDAGNVAVFPAAATAARADDAMLFLAATEKAFWDGMYAYIKKDLGCGALVTGTSVFGPANLWAQSGMDFLDGHAYWQHPHFPGKPWDPTNWTIQQIAMTDHPDESTLDRLAARRLAGKPYTVSEYNHPAPNDYQAECVPLMAAFAAAQDWDAVWFFCYRSRPDEVDHDFFNSFFDIDANPAKWAFMPAGAAIFRQGQLAPLESLRTVPMALPVPKIGEPPKGVAMMQDQFDDGWAAAQQLAKLTRQDLLTARLYTSFGMDAQTGTAKPAPAGTLKTPHEPNATSLRWELFGDRGTFQAAGPGATVYVGHAMPGNDSGPVRLSHPEFAAIMVTPVDNQPLDRSRRILITACGRCQNTDMKFSADRTTVGLNWGKGPVLIEPVTASIDLSAIGVPSQAWTCHALNPDGTPGLAVDVKDNTLNLLPQYKTMWYLLTR